MANESYTWVSIVFALNNTLFQTMIDSFSVMNVEWQIDYYQLIQWIFILLIDKRRCDMSANKTTLHLSHNL